MWPCFQILSKLLRFVCAKVQVVSDTFETSRLLSLLHAKSEVKGLFQAQLLCLLLCWVLCLHCHAEVCHWGPKPLCTFFAKWILTPTICMIDTWCHIVTRSWPSRIFLFFCFLHAWSLVLLYLGFRCKHLTGWPVLRCCQLHLIGTYDAVSIGTVMTLSLPQSVNLIVIVYLVYCKYTYYIILCM